MSHRLALVASASASEGKQRDNAHHNLLHWWHLLSLDAPTVASVWVLFVARVYGLSLNWTSPCAMFAGVWMLYAADRLLDARWSSGSHELEERHHFHGRHRHAFLAGIVVASVALSVLLHRLNEHALQLFAILAVLLAAWLLLIHARSTPSDPAHRLPKELAVGIFFPAAVFIPTVARAPWLQTALFPAAFLFAGVCTLNCLFLYAWEHPQEQRLAHWTTRWAIHHLPGLALLVIAAAILLVAGRFLGDRPHETIRAGVPTCFASACALSTGFLLALHECRARVSSLTLRAAADLCLLTPLLLMPWL